MKRATVLFGINNLELRENMYERFKEFAPKEFTQYLRQRSLQLPFDPDSPALNDAIELARANHESFGLSSKVYYSKKELEEVPFFMMAVPNPLELEGKDIFDYGTNCGNVCPECHIGNTSIDNIFVDQKLIKKTSFGLIAPVYIVSQEVKALIERHNLTGISFSPMIKDHKSREALPFYMVNIKNTLPSFSTSTWIERNSCSKCKHETVILRSELQYEKGKITKAQDFNLTYEHATFDYVKQIVVSSKVRNLFNEYRIRAYFEPITILDE